MWMPGVTHDPLDSTQRQPAMAAHDVVCIHTMVGSLAGTSGMFHAGGWTGTESHYGTGGYGEIVQWQDTAFTADANLNGNDRVISIENADLGPGFAPWNTSDGSAVPGFTAQQAEAVARILAWESSPAAHASCPSSWMCHREGIPLALIPDTRPGRRGVGYHAQGVPGNLLVPGGISWSTARGKVCPGNRRIAQIPSIIDRARAIRVGLTQEGDDMTPEQDLRLKNLENAVAAIAAQLLFVPGERDAAGNLLNMVQLGADDYRNSKRAVEELLSLKAQVAGLVAAVNALSVVH